MGIDQTCEAVLGKKTPCRLSRLEVVRPEALLTAWVWTAKHLRLAVPQLTAQKQLVAARLRQEAIVGATGELSEVFSDGTQVPITISLVSSCPTHECFC